MITFQKQYPAVGASAYVFKFFGEAAPDEAARLSTTGLFDNRIMQSVRLVIEADMTVRCNRALKIRAMRKMAAKLIRTARQSRAIAA